MQDVNGKEISGYRFGPYWFGLLKGRIQGLSGGSFGSENELVGDYDRTLGHYRDNPKLIRVYADGTETQIRPAQEENNG